MGNKQTQGLQHQVITALKKETGFSYCEISDLYRQFRMDTKDLVMTLKQFQEMYREVYPHGDPDRLAERVFATFDKEGKGEIDFREFVDTLSIQLKGTIKMRYEWVYDVLDVSRKGQVRQAQVLNIITILNNLYAGLLPDTEISPEDYCYKCMQVFKAQDVFQHGNDVIAKRDFVNAAMSTFVIQAMSDMVVKAALQPYEVRRERTGSIGRPRADSLRARGLSTNSAKVKVHRDRRTNSVQ